jgi:hypothetical protein
LIAATESPRLSRDLDLFHDTNEALLATREEDPSRGRHLRP